MKITKSQVYFAVGFIMGVVVVVATLVPVLYSLTVISGELANIILTSLLVWVTGLYTLATYNPWERT